MQAFGNDGCVLIFLDREGPLNQSGASSTRYDVSVYDVKKTDLAADGLDTFIHRGYVHGCCWKFVWENITRLYP